VRKGTQIHDEKLAPRFHLLIGMRRSRSPARFRLLFPSRLTRDKASLAEPADVSGARSDPHARPRFFAAIHQRRRLRAPKPRTRTKKGRLPQWTLRSIRAGLSATRLRAESSVVEVAVLRAPSALRPSGLSRLPAGRTGLRLLRRLFPSIEITAERSCRSRFLGDRVGRR
jgi:hypothetical protein